MSLIFRKLLAGLVLFLLVSGTYSQVPEPIGKAVPWNFDVVSLANGASFRGLILKETDKAMDFQVVRRLPGRPTVTLTTSFDKREITLVNRLPEPERAVLVQRLTELDPQNQGERQRMDSLEWTASNWPGGANQAKRYSSDQFTLISAAPEEVSRRAAVRLEQIYAAFARVLPPRHDSGRPTTIYLAGTMSDYRKLLGPAAGNLLNPAVFDPQANQIFCGSDLTKLGEELEQKRLIQQRQREELNSYELQIRKLYRNSKPDLDRFLERVAVERKKLRDVERINDAAFNAATKRLFALLYHESFHSYTTNFVYPIDKEAQLPRWLNEGLAQLFETAVLEAGELRIDHADQFRLDRVKQALKPGGAGLVPVKDLLLAGKDSFLAAHIDQQAAADRVYLTAWALTLYLTFEKRVVGTAEFESFLRARGSPTEILQAFKSWTGQDPDALEKDLVTYLGKLQPDGSLPTKR
jgi:hypothetical protein